MKIIPFPRAGDPRDEQAPAAQIEAALRGESRGEAADYWRELRADVRALAPPISPEFERELRERLTERAADSPRGGARRAGARSLLARAQAWVGSGLRPRLVALGGLCVLAAVITIALDAPWRAPESGSSPSAAFHSSGRTDALGPSDGAVGATGQTHAATSAAAGVGEAAEASGSSPARVQQLAASITLAPKPEGVQSVADQVAQLATRDGGFVQSSQVRLQHGAGGEANLQLSLPSARLSAALAELARLAPTRAQSQSLQDITGEYDAARARLADAVAERQALLRALAKASTQGEIESLHARLSLAAGAISRARTALQSVSKRGSNSAVEVTVLGDVHATAGGSSLNRALHDAGDVLKAALAVLIVAVAVLVPLAILAAMIVLGWRATRRQLRERALS